jgi:hypothetical protein
MQVLSDKTYNLATRSVRIFTSSVALPSEKGEWVVPCGAVALTKLSSRCRFMMRSSALSKRSMSAVNTWVDYP